MYLFFQLCYYVQPGLLAVESYR
uniref:Uncharacterized protein n=1 Tax=Anguilla anguilla TaxID=7936 RepID=A0A0E9TYJ1_ANGAN